MNLTPQSESFQSVIHLIVSHPKSKVFQQNGKQVILINISI